MTIPKQIRERLGIRAGQVLEFEEDRGRIVLTKRATRDATDALYGILPAGRPVDEMLDQLRGRAVLP